MFVFYRRAGAEILFDQFVVVLFVFEICRKTANFVEEKEYMRNCNTVYFYTALYKFVIPLICYANTTILQSLYDRQEIRLLKRNGFVVMLVKAHAKCGNDVIVCAHARM